MTDTDTSLLVDQQIDPFTHPDSVQVIYRPVVALHDADKVPAMPKRDKDDPGYKWWQEQIKRCQFGWVAPNGHYLNGYLYFYLNFCKIPLRKEGSTTFDYDYPYYRDNDEDILNQIWANRYMSLPNGKRKMAKNHVEAKPRGIAWTTFTLLGVGMYYFVFKDDLFMGCAYPNDEVVNTERDWFKQTWINLHPIFKRKKSIADNKVRDLELLNDNKGLFSIGYKVGRIMVPVSQCLFDVIGQETKAGVYKGKRLNLAIAAEAGLWVGDSLKNYITENEPSIKLGGEQWGMFLIGGTSNAIINKSTAYREIFENPGAYNATRHFTPKTRVLYGCIDYLTGKSLEIKALKQIKKSREEKVGDQDSYNQDLIENPLTWEEAFLPNNKTSAYNVAMINEHIAWLKMNHASHWYKGRLEYLIDGKGRPTGKVTFVESADGDWYLNREGMPTDAYQNLHIAGIDDRYKDRTVDHKNTAEDSRNAMVIYRKPTIQNIKSDMPVCVYYGNLLDMRSTYEEFYKGMLFYNIEKTLYEYNHQGFPDFLREKSAGDRLFYINNRPGIKIAQAEKQELTYLGSKYFSEGRYKNITLPLILEELIKWGTKRNTDVASAFHLVLHLLNLTESLSVTIMNKAYEQEHYVVQLGPATKAQRQQDSSDYPLIRLGPSYA